ncbi:hypothetical protein LOZ58_003457 [Ophidiomyces ophidiicola]|nr:hypothetical protein LOZ65_002893 [Ophidiomyces ophidiicola]KAI1938469.1 hypothetical protein LOZ66_003272 [Ophidiomyces ophidiicola]KAI1960971.1 hypothetical protein LOZ58_003457 [Ophidiomyces ophidiicola]
MAESPGSPLSSLASEEFTEDLQFEDRAQSPPLPHAPPPKRRKTGIASWDHHTPMSSIHDEIPPSPSASISSDSSNELPEASSLLSLIGGGIDDDYSGIGKDQVTVCRWEGCNERNLAHMDALVKHIHNTHILSKQKRYLCEWKDCPRKGQSHASGYALRAHMRSHTKEKPFYCNLPEECDRSFTRSDALTKHMRTVHETEALRLVDNMAKSNALSGSPGQPSNKPPRLKLKLSQFSKEVGHESEKNDKGGDFREKESLLNRFDTGFGFDGHELSLPPHQLYALLHRQVYWAEQESRRLESEWQVVKRRRKEVWREKESIFEDVIYAELKVFKSALTAEDLALQAV